jgi:hypothetical protein
MSTNYNAYMVQAYRSVEEILISEPEAWGTPDEYTDLESAIAEAKELSEIHGGAVIYSVVGDMQSGISGLWKLVRKFGQLPPDEDLAV